MGMVESKGILWTLFMYTKYLGDISRIDSNEGLISEATGPVEEIPWRPDRYYGQLRWFVKMSGRRQPDRSAGLYNTAGLAGLGRITRHSLLVGVHSATHGHSE